MRHMKPPSTQAQQRQVDDFNSRGVVGQHVNVRKDDGSVITTTTTSEAEMLGGHTAVVWLEGISGAYLLSRVTPIPLSDDEKWRRQMEKSR